VQNPNAALKFVSVQKNFSHKRRNSNQPESSRIISQPPLPQMDMTRRNQSSGGTSHNLFHRKLIHSSHQSHNSHVQTPPRGAA